MNRWKQDCREVGEAEEMENWIEKKKKMRRLELFVGKEGLFEVWD